MARDKTTSLLLEALKQAVAEPAEQRLYRSGKLPGLFAGRTAVNAEAAAQALRDGLLEVVRTETKGKTITEWVRVTPRGVDFIAQHESPVHAMEELREALATTQEGLPEWMGHIRRTLHDLAERLATDVQSVTRRLEALSVRVEEALRQAQEKSPAVPVAAADAFPWTLDAVAYLDRRRQGNIDGPCPLPELFEAVGRPDLTIADFHAGLRRLQDRGVLRLVPSDSTGELAQPEFALVEGMSVFYHATR